MKIYTAEKDIKQKIISNIKSSCIGTAYNQSCDKDAIVASIQSLIKSEKISDQMVESLNQFVSQDDLHQDLMYGKAILVSTNMNGNDDIFLPSETWVAKNTPINTPFNDNHEQSNIIGHIISSKAVDKDRQTIDSDEVPAYFDIEVGFVVYKTIFDDIAEEIANGIKDNTKFVSMEAIISDFDYGVIDANKVSVIERNEKTAFLTKHLRAYGGSGTFNGRKIGRVLRKIRFIGMGLVDHPGNPNSIFTDIIKAQLKGSDMFETIDQAVEKLESVEAELDETKNNLNENSEKLDEANAKIEVLQQNLDEKETKIQEVSSQLKEVETERDNLQAKIDEIQTAKTLAERTATLSDLGIKLDEEKIGKLSDESFDNIVEIARQIRDNDTGNSDDDEDDIDIEAGEDSVHPEASSEEDDEDSIQTTAKMLANVIEKRMRK